jgi:putative ABC transport system permease protein
VKMRLDAVDANVATVRIDAIVRDPPSNTTIPFELLNGLDLTILPPWAKNEALYGEMGFQGGYLLVRLRADASVDQVTATLQKLADDSPLAARVPEIVRQRAGKDKFVVIKLSPLTDAYMDDEVQPNFFSVDIPRGDPRLVAGLAAVGLLLLALAAINYVNLATLRVLNQTREIMLRKVLGVSRRRLAWLFARESLLASLMAVGAGVGLAVLALPAFGTLMDRDLGGMLTPANLALAIALGLVVGLLTALYPVWLALRVRPARILSGRDAGETTQGARLRRALSVAQLSLAIGLAAVTLGITLQTRHAMSHSVGFDPSRQLVLDLPVGFSAKYDERAANFITELSQAPEIAGVAVATQPAGTSRNRGSNNFQRVGGEIAFLEMIAVSANYFEVHGIAPRAGRLFTSLDNEDTDKLVVINAAAARALGFQSPELAVGQKLRMLEQDKGFVDQEIVGIAPDIRYYSLRETPGPLVYDLFAVGSTLVIQARDSMAATERAVVALWPKYFPNSVFAARPASEWFAANYADDARLARLLALTTLIAMLIAAFGAYVLAADAVQRRTREIALRKLFGARPVHIGKRVARELGSLLAIAGVIALPVAALFIARYLAPFIDRTPLAYVTLVVALLVAALVVAAAAARQTLHAMRLRPAEALRG